MDIEESGALIVGGASGLGAATARELAAAGASVVVADVDQELGAELAAAIGGRFVLTDVMVEADVEAAVRLAREAPRGLRVSVNCAGIAPPQRLIGRDGISSQDGYERVVAINLLGTIRVLRLAASEMAFQDPLNTTDGERGVCINTASIAAFDGQIGQVAYAASKGGVVGLTLPAARDLADRGIRVVTIAPGLFDTPLLADLPETARRSLGASVPFPSRLGRPDEYATLVRHLVANSMMNGEVVRLDGALRMAPR